MTGSRLHRLDADRFPVDNERVPANPPAHARPLSEGMSLVEAERTGRPFLLLKDGDEKQRLFCFASGAASAAVGRRPTSDLVLDWDDQVSRLHARFEHVDGSWVLVDDGLSSNGTFVNGQRLSGRCPLNDGDNLRFGTTTVTFRSPAPPPPLPRAPEPPPAPPLPRAPAVELSTTQRRVLTALCRPYKGRNGYANPATDQQIADELFLSAGVVKTHVSVLCAKLGVGAQSRNEVRVRLVELAFSQGLISESDL